MSRRKLPGPTGGSWSASPTSTSRAAVRQRLDERLHQPDVDHGHLVQNDRVALERIGQTVRA